MPSWAEAILSHRLAPLMVALALATVAERLVGSSRPTQRTADRWWLGAGLWAIGSLAVSAWPVRGPGEPSPLSAWPVAAQAALLLLLADALHYAVHRLMHELPWLWRIHRVHHADADFDVATALRFHPFEWLLSAVPLLSVAGWLAPAPQASALAFGALAVWNVVQHMGLPYTSALERWLGRWVLTPTLHRVHHARAPARSLGNYGLMFAAWDRLLGTWQPPDADVAVGVDDWPHGDDLPANLLSPWSRCSAPAAGQAHPR